MTGSTAFLTTDPLVCFSSRRSAEGKRKFSQVNDLVTCFWIIFESCPEILELTRSLNSYFLECYIWSCRFYQNVFMSRWRLNFLLVFLKSFVQVRLVFSVSQLLNTNWTNSFHFMEIFLEDRKTLADTLLVKEIE